MASLLRRAIAHVNPTQLQTIERLGPNTPLHELGIESVAIMEMAAFIENELGIELDDYELSGLATLADFADLLRREASARVAAPVRMSTVVDLVRSLEGVERVGPTFLDGELRPDAWTFDRLASEAKARAQHLWSVGLEPGDTLAMLIPEAADFVPTFFACVLAGVVPVPMALPSSMRGLDEYVARCARILAKAGCRSLVAPRALVGALAGLKELDLEHVIIADELRGSPAAPDFVPPCVGPNDPCFLQFTSGSTGEPKGTIVTHANLLANAKAIMVDGLNARPELDLGVSWLPLYHDMGLVGFVIAPLLTQVPTVFMPTTAFMRRPGIWMELMAKYRGTISFAPNFAYGLAARRAGDVSKLDLGCVRALGCGAEPVQARTLREFAAAYATAGLKPEAIMPAYGMAEATLAISFDRLDQPFRVERLDRALFEAEQRVAPPRSGGGAALEIVSCGRPFPRHQVLIVNERKPVREGHVGEIWFRGPSRTPGYVGGPEADDWLATGDLGFMLDGELFVTGRKKELIIVHGRKCHPYDIESEVGSVEHVRKGNVVAFSVQHGDSEALIVVAESSGAAERVSTADIRQRVKDAFQLAIAEVLIVEKGTLPKTSSGKLQRTCVRELWLRGALSGEVQSRPGLAPALACRERKLEPA